jgi:hypothetical protein
MRLIALQILKLAQSAAGAEVQTGPAQKRAGAFNICSQDDLYVQGEGATTKVKPLPLTHGRKHHFYCSRSCMGAAELAKELSDLTSVQWTDQLDSLVDCEHLLLYLTSATWTSGEVSAQFALEVCEAHRLGVHLLLAHEFPSMIDDASQRGACSFNDFWNEGWTPKHLLQGDANVYRQIAIALKPGEWRKAGLVTVLDKMRSFDGKRKVIEVGPCEVVATELGGESPLDDAESSLSRPAPFVEADPVNRRGSLVHEDDATFVQAEAVRSRVQANPRKEAGAVQAGLHP